MAAWDVNLYLQFGNERAQPSIDLVSRVMIADPKRIIDLGCGPGNSTSILRRRWPNARVAGLDSSPEMIAAARQNQLDQEWILADATAWQAASPFDIVFSNAALQWMPDHERLLPRLLANVAPGGALAFQIPSRLYSPSHQFILQIAEDPEWAHRMSAPKSTFHMEHPPFYYDVLAPHAARLDIWETEYYHVMENHQGIMDWINGAALRPFLDALETNPQRERFVRMLRDHIVQVYPPRANGKVLFPFRRLFVIAYR